MWREVRRILVSEKLISVGGLNGADYVVLFG